TSLARPFGDQVGPCGGKLGQTRIEIGDLVGNVMHAGSALGKETADGGVFAERLEQLDPSVADPHRGRADALLLDRRPMLDLCAEEPRIRREGSVQILHCDAEMMDPPRLHEAKATNECGW